MIQKSQKLHKKINLYSTNTENKIATVKTIFHVHKNKIK